MATYVYKPRKASSKASIAERLEARSIPEPNSGCVLWLGGCSGADRRYGCIHINGRTHQAHRLAWIDRHGPIPDGLFVCHKCDVPECINPDHLFLGTNSDNMADRNRKGRTNRPIGEKHPRARLTADQVRAIRKDPRSGSIVGPEYGIAKSTVDLIRSGHSWKHLA